MKPTTKEIDYFTHPDQAWLQEEWEPAVGDWFLWVEHRDMGAVPEHVCVMSEIEEPQEIGELDGEVYWLPTLSDLLGMIEDAGYDVLASSWTEDDERRYEYTGCERATVETNWSSAWVYTGFLSSWEIAAAELLKKVRDASRDN